MQISFEAIATIKSDYKNPKDLIFACEQGLKTKTHSQIILDQKFKDGLKGLAQFSHIWVIYHLNLAKKLELLTYPGTPEMTELPKVGVFASRSQYRPNKIALRLVEIEKVDDNIVYVTGLDAVDGSQVLDIKPYVPGFDRPKEFRRADWYEWLDL